VPEPAAPQARRLRQPSWRDTRLVVGVLVVLASVVLGAQVVAAADDTVPVYAAAGTLSAGDPVRAQDVTVLRASLGEGAGRYVSARAELPAGLVALRTVGAGELLPAAAVGDASVLTRRPVGVPHPAALPSGLVKGARVDVWVSAPDDARPGAVRAPEQLAAAAEVAEVSTGAGALGAAAGATVHVLLAEAELAEVLGALAADADVAVVLVPGSAPGGTP
jgi:hypothetical protein